MDSMTRNLVVPGPPWPTVEHVSVGADRQAGRKPPEKPVHPACGLGFRVWGLGFRVWGLGFRGLGFRV